MRNTVLILKPAHDVPPLPPTPTNEMLLGRIKERDGEALWMLYNRHSDFLRGVIARTISDEEVCDDVLREVFEEIRDRASHYSPEMGQVLGWISTLARRRATERMRGIQQIPRTSQAAPQTVNNQERTSRVEELVPVAA